MDQTPTEPPAGSMTVSALFQLETVMIVVGLAAVVALVVALVLVAGLGSRQRPEWEDWLAARSAARHPTDRV